VVTATWIALFGDTAVRARAAHSSAAASAVAQPHDVMRFQLSDVVSLLVETYSTGEDVALVANCATRVCGVCAVVTIVFDEQAEPVGTRLLCGVTVTLTASRKSCRNASADSGSAIAAHIVGG
jgi:hypothetical protein